MEADGGSIVSLDFDGQVAWPIYDWMGVAKAGLEAVTRYLARDLGSHGIRVNTVSAGPIRTMAGKGIPGFDQITDSWGERAPLGWDPTDPGPVGDVGRVPPVRSRAGDQRRADPRRRRVPRDGHRPARRRSGARIELEREQLLLAPDGAEGLPQPASARSCRASPDRRSRRAWSRRAPARPGDGAGPPPGTGRPRPDPCPDSGRSVPAVHRGLRAGSSVSLTGDPAATARARAIEVTIVIPPCLMSSVPACSPLACTTSPRRNPVGGSSRRAIRASSRRKAGLARASATAASERRLGVERCRRPPGSRTRSRTGSSRRRRVAGSMSGTGAPSRRAGVASRGASPSRRRGSAGSRSPPARP